MLFVATCVDKPHSADKRKENRPAHVSCLNGLGARLKIGGALPAAAHRTPIGSMITFEGESEDDILALLAKNPNLLAGLFESVSVKLWRHAVGQIFA